MTGKILIIALLSITLASTAFAKTQKVSLNSTGYDWLGYDKENKKAFAGLLYMALNVDKNKYKPDDVIKELDDYYYTAIKEAKADPLHVDEDKFLRVRCVDVISNQLDIKAEIRSAREAP